MNPPRVYTCSPSWTPLPPPSLYHPSGSSQCTSPKHPVSNLDWWFVSYMILYMFQCHSPKSSHPLPLPQSPKDCSIHQCLFCCLIYRVTEKAMAPHSSTLAWKIPWTEEPGRLQSMGSLRVGHDWATSLSLVTFMHWWRKWQPTPVFLPGESQGQQGLVGCRLWGCTELDTTEAN